MKCYIRFLRVFPSILGNMVFCTLLGKKGELYHTFLNAPIGIIGMPNAIIWEASHLFYTRIELGEEIFYTTSNRFEFRNPNSPIIIKVTHVGFTTTRRSRFQLHLLNIQQKYSSPFMSQSSWNINQSYQPLAITSSLKLSGLELQQPTHSIGKAYPLLNDTYSHLTPEVELSDQKAIPHLLLKELQQNNNQTDFIQLTNQLKSYGKFLPKSATRPYHEMAMEGRRF